MKKDEMSVFDASLFPATGEFRIGRVRLSYAGRTATTLLGVRLRLHWWHRFLWRLGFRPLTTDPEPWTS